MAFAGNFGWSFTFQIYATAESVGLRALFIPLLVFPWPCKNIHIHLVLVRSGRPSAISELDPIFSTTCCLRLTLLSPSCVTTQFLFVPLQRSHQIPSKIQTPSLSTALALYAFNLKKLLSNDSKVSSFRTATKST